jgi:hypothetical protein
MRMTHLMYAEDPARLQSDLLGLEEAMGRHGLAINAGKSSALHMGEDGG